MADVGAAWQNGYAERPIRTVKEEEVNLSAQPLCPKFQIRVQYVAPQGAEVNSQRHDPRKCPHAVALVLALLLVGCANSTLDRETAIQIYHRGWCPQCLQQHRRLRGETGTRRGVDRAVIMCAQSSPPANKRMEPSSVLSAGGLPAGGSSAAPLGGESEGARGTLAIGSWLTERQVKHDRNCL
jgi:hypothetical protein